MHPTIVEISPNADVVKEELFGPLLYVMKFQVATSFQFRVVTQFSNLELYLNFKCLIFFLQSLKEAIEINNSVPQGLSSSIFTRKPEIIFKWIG